MIEHWIDGIAEVAESVSAPGGQNVLAYRMFRKTDWPESLNRFPCALSFVDESVDVAYDAGGACRVIWRGVTEFHLTPKIDRKAYPELLLFYGRVIEAWAAHATLGGRVAYCMLRPEGAISAIVEMQYGREAPHFGLIVNWIVKEVLTVSVGG